MVFGDRIQLGRSHNDSVKEVRSERKREAAELKLRRRSQSRQLLSHMATRRKPYLQMFSSYQTVRFRLGGAGVGRWEEFASPRERDSKQIQAVIRTCRLFMSADSDRLPVRKRCWVTGWTGRFTSSEPGCNGSVPSSSNCSMEMP